MAAPPASAWLAACHLPQAWQDQHAWRVLDTDFDGGARFFALWQAWALDPRACRMLHVVALCARAPERSGVLRTLADWPALRGFAHELERQWFGLLPGFHRLMLHEGRLLLTVCIGPVRPMLRAQQFLADSVFLAGSAGAPGCGSDGTAPPWDRWTLKALGRLCRRGTALALWPANVIAPEALALAGFTPLPVQTRPAPDADAPTAESGRVPGWQFQPRWRAGSTRDAWRGAPADVTHCAVIGAGLAGAAVASALARRGWRVTVLDGAAEPAAGASGLPVGLLAPHVSRDDSARSRLSRAGVRLTLETASRWLRHGQDWAWTGVAQCETRGGVRLPHPWPQAGRQWSDAALPPAARRRWDGARCDDAIWHAAAGWIKPARLVQALLAHPAIRFAGNSRVLEIGHQAGQWELIGAGGAVLARAPQLVLACAGDAVRLVARAALAREGVSRLAPMAAVHGQVSWAAHRPGDASLFAPFPVNGDGSVIAHVPVPGGTAWFAGATYEPATAAAPGPDEARAQNLARLERLLPAAAGVFTAADAVHAVGAWRGTRCTTADRLPAAGALETGAQPSLWVSAAMGSRGLTYAVLCAELIAAQLAAEPCPLEAALHKSIRASRKGLSDHL